MFRKREIHVWSDVRSVGLQRIIMILDYHFMLAIPYILLFRSCKVSAYE
jgi:hypothetical protein